MVHVNTVKSLSLWWLNFCGFHGHPYPGISLTIYETLKEIHEITCSCTKLAMKKFGFYKFKWFALVKWMNNFCKPMKSVDLFWPCFGRVEMVCFSRCLLPAVTLGSSSCLSSVSGMTSKEKASPLLSTAVLFGFVAGSPTTDGLWEKLSNNWTLCDHESFEELWHLNVFSAIFMQITFYFSIYTEIDFDHVHLWL